MKKEDIFKTLAIYKKILEERGYIVLYIGLYGSQNYNVDDEQYDIDAKAIILPNLHDIIFRKVTSTVIECENGSIDVKDLLTFYDVIKKGNFSYIEAIDTEYSVGDKYLKDLFGKVRPNFKSLVGAMYEKRKALTHKFPSKEKEFEMFGCDPKQYHHIVRLYDLLSYNVGNNLKQSYLKYDEERRNYMITIKRSMDGKTVQELEQESDDIINRARELLDYNTPNYSYEYTDLDDKKFDYTEAHLKEVLQTTEYSYAETYRLPGKAISRKHIKKFPSLKELTDCEDVRYTIYESIEILGGE